MAEASENGGEVVWLLADSIKLEGVYTHMYLHSSGESVMLIGAKGKGDARLFDVVRGGSEGLKLAESEVMQTRMDQNSFVQLDFANLPSQHHLAPAQFGSFLIVPNSFGSKSGKLVYVYTSNSPPPSSVVRGGGRWKGVKWQEDTLEITFDWLKTCCFSSRHTVITAETDYSCEYEKKEGKWTCTLTVNKEENKNKYFEHQRIHFSKLPPSSPTLLLADGKFKLELAGNKLKLFKKEEKATFQEREKMILQMNDVIDDCSKDSLLETFGGLVLDEDEEEMHERKGGRSINLAGVLGRALQQREGEAVGDITKTIRSMLTVAAGFNTVEDSDSQKRVQSALNYIEHHLPKLREELESRMATIQAVNDLRETSNGSDDTKAKQGGMVQHSDVDDERLKKGVARGHLLNKMLQKDHLQSSNLTRVVTAIKETIAESIQNMKNDVMKTEEEMNEKWKAPLGAREYLVAMNEKATAKSKAAISHFLSMSNLLRIDLLSLSGRALDSLCGMDNTGFIDAYKNARMKLQQECNEIGKYKADSGSARIRTAHLSSLLAGVIPDDMGDTAANKTWIVMSHYIAEKTTPSPFCKIPTDIQRNWAWLKGKHAEWSEVEARSGSGQGPHEG
mmetsp:Transcript_41133/g.106300  ORF Transcript_41133/g.106300 Transcript_41133/m.106300 type:complete len:619 (-) Transcript_41133:147-2003(-)